MPSDAAVKTAEKSEFTLTSVEKADPPGGSRDDEWHSYVIERGVSTIVGRRAGSLTSVTRYAKAFTAELNERMRNGGKPVWSPRSKPKK